MPTFTEEDVVPQGGTFTADDVAHGTFTLDDIAPSPTPEVDKAVAQVKSIRSDPYVQDILNAPSPESYYKPSEHPIAEAAGQAAINTVKGFVPRSVGQAAQMLTPLASAPHEIVGGIGAIKDFIDGKPVDEINKERFPQSQLLVNAEKTPPYSRERFEAGFNVIANMVMGAGIVHGLTRAPVARPEGESATLAPPEAQTRPIQATGGLETPSGKLTREKIPIGYEFRAPNAADDFVMYRYEGNGEVTDLDTGQTHKLSQKQIDDTEGFIRTTPKYAKGVQPGPMYMLEPPASLASVYKPKPFEETTQTPQLKLLEGEPNAQQPSNAQVESGDTALGEQTRPQGAEPQTGSSDNVVGETGGEKPIVEGTPPQEDVAVAQPEGGGEPAAAAVSGAETPPAAKPPRSVTSLQNAVTEAERINRGLNPREETESQSWDKAKSIAQSEAAADPGKGARLVEELNQQPRALDDVEGVHLLNRKVEVNREFDSALENLRRNPDDVDAIARMTKAREDAYKMYQATEASGTAWGRGGRIRQAMMADDYSMSRMEATRRVANKGKPLSTSQMMEVADHYSKISKQEARIKVAEDSLQTPSGRMRPQEILNAVEQMKRRLTPCL